MCLRHSLDRASEVALLGMMGLLSFVVGDSVDHARVGMIDVDSWALTMYRSCYDRKTCRICRDLDVSGKSRPE